MLSILQTSVNHNTYQWTCHWSSIFFHPAHCRSESPPACKTEDPFGWILPSEIWKWFAFQWHNLISTLMYVIHFSSKESLVELRNSLENRSHNSGSPLACSPSSPMTPLFIGCPVSRLYIWEGWGCSQPVLKHSLLLNTISWVKGGVRLNSLGLRGALETQVADVLEKCSNH